MEKKSSDRDSSRLWVGAGEAQLLQETEEERKDGYSASANAPPPSPHVFS